jgi:hypothetical protein
MKTYWFEIALPKGKTYVSEKFRTYSSFIKACEKKCRELRAYSDDVTLYVKHSDTGNVFFGKPEHGEINV